jgi:hypothetical protein
LHITVDFVSRSKEATLRTWVTPPTYFKIDSTIGFIAVISCRLLS